MIQSEYGKNIEPSSIQADVEFDETETLFFLEDPVITLCRKGDNNFLVSWADYDEDLRLTTYMRIASDMESVKSYKESQITLRNVMEKSSQIVLIDFDEKWNVVEAKEFKFSEIPDEIMPTEDSFFNNPDAYVETDNQKISP